MHESLNSIIKIKQLVVISTQKCLRPTQFIFMNGGDGTGLLGKKGKREKGKEKLLNQNDGCYISFVSGLVLLIFISVI